MAISPPEGIYVPVPTFFASKTTSNYNPIASPPDVSTQAAHAVYLAKSGIKGLVVLGSTGEAVHLTNQERNEVVRGVRQELDKAGFRDYPIMAGTATQGVEDTVEQLKDAKRTGAQWGLVLTPGYFAASMTQEGLHDWYTAVADRSPVPILIYNYPGVSNNVLVAPSLMEKLAQHPNIVGCKLSHGALDDHALIGLSPNIDHNKFRTFTGLGQQLLPVLTVGGAGAIDGLAGFFPKTVIRLYNLFRKSGSLENLEEMRRLQYKVSAGEKLVVKFGTVGIKEAVSRLRGFGDMDGGRLPFKGGIPGGEVEWKKWKPIMDALEEVEKSQPETQ